VKSSIIIIQRVEESKKLEYWVEVIVIVIGHWFGLGIVTVFFFFFFFFLKHLDMFLKELIIEQPAS